ncbi:MAG: L-2-amino-thiazoline-4-carboxylic acid hydrolase [Desulfofustis sp.]|nr:L-2-amino-thiazoline-4-carboxylic acid hydrolase [Desulfofustis sp.]
MEMSRLEKRGIEALAIAPVIREVSRRYGDEEARAILKSVNQKEAFERGRKMAGNKQANSIDILVKDVATWGDTGVWEMEVVEQTPTTYFFNVTRCPYYEKYRELGLEEFGVELSCCRDEPFTRGLNPNLRLVRTKTIMEGEGFCDFRYSLVPEE